jgi:hypothetical protein
LEASVGDSSGKAGRKTINLALQGGGSHGAFAWGALDRILEDERIVIEGIVGTSAGAMNAVVTAYGLTPAVTKGRGKPSGASGKRSPRLAPGRSCSRPCSTA